MKGDYMIGLLGNGGHADEVGATCKNVLFRAISKEYMHGSGLVDLDSPSEEQKNTPVNVAVGSPLVRKRMVLRWPGVNYATVVSDRSIIEDDSSLGQGCYVAHNAVITTKVSIGDHVIMGVGSSVHHDCKVGDFVTISPGVHIGGKSILGNGVFIGLGASILNGIRIADGVVVGAGATVADDCLQENGVYVGVPARLVKVNEDWMNEI